MADWSVSVDLPSFLSPRLITGDIIRLDFIMHNKHKNKMHNFELTVGFESNLEIDSESKLCKYRLLITSRSTSFQEINII